MTLSNTGVTRDPVEKQQRILDAALELFALRGFYGTSVPSVAELAAVGAGTIYRYFESKEALVNSLYRREKQAFMAGVTSALNPGTSPREQFGLFVKAVFAYAQQHPRAVQFLEHHHHQSYLDATSRALEEQGMTMARAFLDETERAKITKPFRPEVLIGVVWGGIVMQLKQAWEGQVALTPEVLEQTEAVLWEAVRL